MPELQRRPQAAVSPPPSLLARHFLADELPEALRPTQDNHRLQVAVIWGGDRLLEVRDVTPGEEFTLGPTKSTVSVYESLPSFGPVPFIKTEKDGTQHIFLPESGAPVVRRDGKDLTAEELRKARVAEDVDVPVRGVRLPMSLADRITLKFGSLQLVARYTKPETFRTRSFIERMDMNFVSGLVILALAATVGVKMMQITPRSALTEEESIQRLKDITSTFRPEAMPKPPPKTSGAQAPRGPEGTIGHRNLPHREAAPPPPNDQQRRTQNLAAVQRTDMMRILNGSGAAAQVLDSATSVAGLENSLGNVTGAQALASNGGLEGLGSRGSEAGGGGHGVTIGGLNRGPREGSGPGTGPGFSIPGIKKVIVPIQKAEVAGIDNSYREQIARVIRIHWNEIKYCYEKELQKDPNLDGKVAVSFDIGPAGAVTQASIREATLDSQDAQTCIVNSVRRWAFPAPPTGVVQVNYPFLFSAAR